MANPNGSIRPVIVSPHTDAGLELFVTASIAKMTNAHVWNALVQHIGEETAKQILKKRFMAPGDNDPINWHPGGLVGPFVPTLFVHLQ